MNWLEKITLIFQKYNIPDWIWKPIMQTESGGDPSSVAITANEASYGLFQINRFAHPEYKISDLLDPVSNAEIIARDFISPAIKSAGIDVDIPDIFSAQVIYSGLKDPNDPSKGYLSEGGIRPKWTEYIKNLFTSNFESVRKYTDEELNDILGEGIKKDKTKNILGLPTKADMVKTVLIFLILVAVLLAGYTMLKNETNIDMSGIENLAKLKGV